MKKNAIEKERVVEDRDQEVDLIHVQDLQSTKKEETMIILRTETDLMRKEDTLRMMKKNIVEDLQSGDIGGRQAEIIQLKIQVSFNF
jgi:hypothetical protein